MDRVENSVAKGEIAQHEQFPLLPQCFQKPSASYVGKIKPYSESEDCNETVNRFVLESQVTAFLTSEYSKLFLMTV